MLKFLLKFLVNFFSDLISLQSQFLLPFIAWQALPILCFLNKPESLGLYLLSIYKVYRIVFLRGGGGGSSCGSTLSSWAGSGSSGVL